MGQANNRHEEASHGSHDNGATAVAEFRHTPEEVERRFGILLEQWTRETHFESNYSRLMAHPAYRKILGLGPQVVPLLLKNLVHGSGPWLAALEDITGENPIRVEHEHDARLMVEDWLEWGRRHGII